MLVLDREALLSAARDLGVSVPTKTKRNGEAEADLRVRLSEVAVHPETGELWLCSAADNALLVVTRAGRLVGLHFFAEDELPQLEAAAFLPTGELVLASEGVDGPAPLRVFGRAR